MRPPAIRMIRLLCSVSYCRIAPGHPFHGPYHDREYGFPIRSDAALLERLALEINQAGLSWLTMLKKREAFRRAFAGFEPEKVARFGRRESQRLLRDAGIVRNRLKVAAVIENARRILALRRTTAPSRSGSTRTIRARAKEWHKLFKETFVFTGGEIVGSFLLSTGYLRGAHVPSCPVYAKVAKKKPAWMRAREGEAAPGLLRGATPLPPTTGGERLSLARDR